MGGGQGQAQGDGGAAPGAAVESHVASEDGSALFHAEQAERFWVAQGVRRQAAAIIGDFEDHAAALLAKSHSHLRRLRVPRHVGEGFLEDAKDSGGHLRRQLRLALGKFHLAKNAGAFVKSLRLVLERGEQSELIEHARTQFSRDALDGGDGLVGEFPGFDRLVDDGVQRGVAFDLTDFLDRKSVV